MSQAKSLGGRKLKLPTAYCPDRMRHRDNFRDFYQRMRIADQRLGLDYSTGNKRMMIDLWLSRLSPDLLRQVSHATKKQFEFETIYHLYEMCCCIQFHDQVEVMRRNLVNHRFVDRHPEWADFEAFLATNEKELGYDRIEDRGELLEKKAFDLCLARFTRKRLEKLRLLTNELENITTETELLKVLREIDWSKEPPYTLTKYWRDVKAKEEAENFLESFLPTIKSEPEGTVVKKEKSESEEREETYQSVNNASKDARPRRIKEEHVEVEEKHPSLNETVLKVEEQDTLTFSAKDKTMKHKLSHKIKEEDSEDGEQEAAVPAVKDNDRSRKHKESHKGNDEAEESKTSAGAAKRSFEKREKGRRTEGDDGEVEEDKSRKRKKSPQIKKEDIDDDSDEAITKSEANNGKRKRGQSDASTNKFLKLTPGKQQSRR
ncbi:hypothetical protein HDK77DRAFT_504078 [Phyllosticta capitalensis]